jgi:hypothetical protein
LGNIAAEHIGFDDIHMMVVVVVKYHPNVAVKNGNRLMIVPH